jgi:hypothetical protein
MQVGQDGAQTEILANDGPNTIDRGVYRTCRSIQRRVGRQHDRCFGWAEPDFRRGRVSQFNATVELFGASGTSSGGATRTAGKLM